MFKALKEFFFGKPVEKFETPYKVETPEPVVAVVTEKVEAVVVPVAAEKPKKARAKKETTVVKKVKVEKSETKPAKIRKPRAPKPTM